MLAAATRRRSGGMVVLDLAVPRDVEPAAHELPAVVLRDIDEIQRLAAMNLDSRRRELPRAWSIVRSEAKRFQAWRAQLDVEPLLDELRRRAEEIPRAELDRAFACEPELDEAQQELLDTVTRRLLKKLLHDPTQRIRRAGATAAGCAQLEAMCDLFGLTPATGGKRREDRRRLTVVA
jgi:glutamyl-tRNA reductase